MGAKKMAKDLGLTTAEAKARLAGYYAKLPFIKETTNLASRTAARRGYIFTILGRRRRFCEWEPSDWDLSQEFRTVDDVDRKSAADVRKWVARRVKEAQGNKPRYGVKRAWTYRALNAVIQGSAADLMKKSMVDIWEAGICDVLGAPLLTVHDELDYSVPDTKEGREAFEESVRLMEKAIKFRVPVRVDAKLKKDWGTDLTAPDEMV
jgi:DNA polymerase-1